MATVVRRSERHNARSVIVVELCPLRSEKAVKIVRKTAKRKKVKGDW